MLPRALKSSLEPLLKKEGRDIQGHRSTLWLFFLFYIRHWGFFASLV